MNIPKQEKLPFSEKPVARLNVRIDSVLRDEFEVLCKENHTNTSVELRRYMLKCVRAGKLF